MRKGRDGGKKTGEKKEKTDDYSGHYVIASSQPLERRPLERRTLVPIGQFNCFLLGCSKPTNKFQSNCLQLHLPSELKDFIRFISFQNKLLNLS